MLEDYDVTINENNQRINDYMGELSERDEIIKEKVMKI